MKIFSLNLQESIKETQKKYLFQRFKLEIRSEQLGVQEITYIVPAESISDKAIIHCIKKEFPESDCFATARNDAGRLSIRKR